jgi:hypothetical protein
MRYAFFVLLRAMPAWLRLTRVQRAARVAEHLTPLIARSEAIRLRYFDAEAFSAACSDVMMIETDDPRHHYFFMERLRDSVLISEPLFEVVQIVPAIEEGYVDFEQAEADATPS